MISVEGRFTIVSTVRKSKARYAIFNNGDIVTAKLKLMNLSGASNGNYTPTVELYDAEGEVFRCSLSINEFANVFHVYEDDDCPRYGHNPVYSIVQWEGHWD